MHRATGHGAWIHEPTASITEHPCRALPRRGNLEILAIPPGQGESSRQFTGLHSMQADQVSAHAWCANRSSRHVAQHDPAMTSWTPRLSTPPDLVRPVPIDPEGRLGPTRGQAAGPRWRRTSNGLYVDAKADRNVAEQRILEESHRLPGVGAVTGWAALRLHGVRYLDGLASDGRRRLAVPLVLPPGTTLRPVPGVSLHRERLEQSELTHVHGIPTTSAERATFDAARRAGGLRDAVAVLDSALAARVIARPAFDRYLQAKSGWPGIRLVQRGLGLCEPRTLSPKETALRLIWMLDGGLPRPKCNWPVADARRRYIGRPDLLSEEHAVIGEFDGAGHRTREQHREDHLRDDRFRAVGLEPFRVVGADLEDAPLVLRRITAAIERSAHSAVPRTWLTQTSPGPVA